MQRAVLNQLARAGHICGATRKGRYCVLLPDHDGPHTADLRAFPSSPLMRERVRGGYRRARRYYRFAAHRTWGRRAWKARQA